MSGPVAVTPVGPDALAQCVDFLRGSVPVAIPTDTIYGLAARAADAAGVQQLFALKQRPVERSIAALVAGPDQAARVAEIGPSTRRLVDVHWPGALTVVVPRRPESGLWVGGDDGTIGLRCPDHDFVRALAAEVGPLAVTSANISGHPNFATPEEIADAFGDQLGLVVSDIERHGLASSVVRVTDTADGPLLEMLREGGLNQATLAATLGLRT